MTFVDSNVLLDLGTADPVWADWSARQLEAAILLGPVWINDVVYAELSVRVDRMEAVDAFLEGLRIEIRPSSRPALFLASKAFANYRARGGARTGVLPDFFIGAQAAIEGLPLLTRDATRFRTHFPTVQLIAP
ncbi:MAG: type II toxin-antitoxin system VapC family toxin [Caulobacter sp.]|nr:type II toxin-antitoxin system VapC family toxin [Caulobacter sp.]